MGTKQPKLFDVGGIRVEIGPPFDGWGPCLCARQVRGSAWFNASVPMLRAAIAIFGVFPARVRDVVG